MPPGAVLNNGDAGGSTKRPTKGKEGVKKGGSKKAGKGILYNDQCRLWEETSGDYWTSSFVPRVILGGLFPAFAGYLYNNKHANRSMPIVSQRAVWTDPSPFELYDQPKACDTTMGTTWCYAGASMAAVDADFAFSLLFFIRLSTLTGTLGNNTLSAAGASTASVSSADQPDGTKVDLRVGLITRVWTHETADK